ncbi:A nuclease family of the HNH/ENDO VII superfamily with conserved AHH [Alteromonadaceae bacterium Bs31]|nr:A nuclease family of the HNH/ENDO VII superfamily with conserved AHH [Alteromonadaceae bacterium Bs31]
MGLTHSVATNHAIAQFAKQGTPSLLDWHRVKSVSTVQCRLLEYEAAGQCMDFNQLLEEQHKSGLLAQHMQAMGEPRPHKECHCHAIISGAHPKAAAQRAIMAWVKMRVDFPANGSWLPRNTAAKKVMPSNLKRAVPHSRIHRNNYYDWLDTLINTNTITSADDGKALKDILRTIRTKLETSTFPSSVMKPAGQK